MLLSHEGRSFDCAIFSVADLRAAGVPVEQINIARRRDAYDRIDAAAGRARARFVSPGVLVAEEYRAARDAVQRWRDAGTPADDVPPEIQSGADYRDITHEQAAAEIEQTAGAYETGLSSIRTVRLTGKKAVREASGDDIDAAADAAIAQLDAIQPPAGIADA